LVLLLVSGWRRGFRSVEHVREVHVDLVADDLDGEHRDGIVGGQLERLAAAQVELGAVAPAFDHAPFHFALGQ